ncbi:hypothetical protein [Streptomyces kaempferi]|uniref:AMP-binding enzyme C-terminal domain-containing protein n=1 Tax=Streptomyces kaempferi TaxID=333725 RepID=A0ABW3XQB2_9ACTN
MIPLAAAPGSPALMTASDALPGYQALAPAVTTFRNEALARACRPSPPTGQRAAGASSLSGYKRPASLVVLDAIPKNAVGKIDRQANWRESQRGWDLRACWPMRSGSAGGQRAR